MSLEAAKVGDVIAIMRYAYGGRTDITRATVTRTTATRVTADNGYSFMRASGRKVGDSSTWRPVSARLWTQETDERLSQMEADTQLRAKKKRLHETVWDKFNAEEIEIVIAALDQVLAAHREAK